ncbi:MAG TPA: sensor histidine kinase [Termitinemataceae bacterium]|jgi:two-component system sensor histidine kinase YesM|uniref:sensor histidine kinase n=1 Tax=Treponema sp. J25 TaxID=2094121 RepID=UPI00104B7FED|nr:sensor histidine kinase [Treponema sp. J25]TCW61129.1 histidine kinase [Treponema sp. J25]HOK00041.1 sensor histidine kinase [Termitinemataceae bacterium]HOM24255.1 sensor histidine kinase [Termitinemataceae bacterium]HPQ01336.1 sensor histidine kinase [Termitinemataceae bacterium]
MSERAASHSHSIQVTMALAFSVVSVSIIVAAILLSYAFTEEAARLSSRTYTRQLIRQIAQNVDMYIDYMKSISSFIQGNQDIQGYLSATEESRFFSRQRAREVLETIIRSRKDISLVALFDMQGKPLFHDERLEVNPHRDPRRENWFVSAMQRPGESHISSSHVQNILKNQYRWVISLSRCIVSEQDASTLGILLVDLNYDLIQRICSSVRLGKRGYVFIIDGKGELVYHPQQQLIYSGLKKENIPQILETKSDYFIADIPDMKVLYSVQNLQNVDWKVVGVNYKDELVENQEHIRRTYALWGVAFFSISILLSIVVAQQISRPIKRLRNSMRLVEQGNFHIRSNIRANNEIGELARDFNLMVEEIEKLLYRIKEQQEAKRKSELKALQMQINPHFLYNTLDSIIWMAEGGKQTEVVEMSAALAKLFRLSISKGREIVTIGSEVEHVRNYLTIQKIRYRDRLDYRIEIPDLLIEYRTVKIILQPLVENAIYHGIKNKGGPGLVVIGGCLIHEPEGSRDRIELFVQDDGVGMDDETLQRLRKRLGRVKNEGLPSESEAGGFSEGESGASFSGEGGLSRKGGTSFGIPLKIADNSHSGTSHHGLGVLNVDERIKLYFGPAYGLRYESQEGKGTTVYIDLPAILEDIEE